MDIVGLDKVKLLLMSDMLHCEVGGEGYSSSCLEEIAIGMIVLD